MTLLFAPMPLSALLLALAAAFVHALWNILLARAPNIEAATVVALVVAEVVFAPVAWLTWNVHAAAWPYIAASGALELVYFAFLVNAYRLAELSVVYPIARGTAPVLVLVVGVVALGYATSAGQVAGVCLVGLGVLLVRGFRRSQGWGVPFGLVIACTIAAYTLVDKHGVAHAGAIPYLEMSMLVPTIAYAVVVGRGQGPGAVREAFGPSTLVAGFAVFGAYALVLLALQRAAAAPVAAVRETSVVITALLARHVLDESVGGRRLAGAAAVAAGIALLSLT
jgi:drug/metabolite transporter (DMT)-like permease